MASKYVVGFALIACALVLVPTLTEAMAAEYVVGDDQGWNVGVNYTVWASGKVFNVGDKLVFKYQPPHNVFKVDGAGFKDCTPQGENFTSGNDTITLAKPGKKWYICGVPGHCAGGQKLVINVESNGPTPAPAPPQTPTPTPAPSSNHSYRLFSSSWWQIFAAAVAVMVAMITV